MIRCAGCGKGNRDLARFCGSCGAPLSREGPAASDKLLHDRYRITRVLSQGGMGVSYLAEDTLAKNAGVLIKESFFGRSDPSSGRNNTSYEGLHFLLHEATMLMSLNHPNLPSVRELFVEPSGNQYLVLDWIEGEDLQKTLERQRGLPEPLLLPLLSEVCGALEYLHGHTPPIIHHSIQPANIMVTKEGRCILLYDHWMVEHLCSPGERDICVGDAARFWPIESYARRGGDARSDIYALGATTYYCLTGRVPASAIQRATGERLTPPFEINPAISYHVGWAILKEGSTAFLGLRRDYGAITVRVNAVTIGGG